ncbi:thymidine phosphorylase [Candidatus Pacearchaeota archaeon]|nr:thymidine phosphorylase [Candidatus Pacearchaeota archaeon]
MKTENSLQKTLKIKRFMIESGRPIVFLNEKTAEAMQISAGDRVVVVFEAHKRMIAMVDLMNQVSPSEIVLSKEFSAFINGSVKRVTVYPASYPKSLPLIVKKMHGKELDKLELRTIIEDITQNALMEAEVAYFVSAVYEEGMTFKETVNLTDAISSTGARLSWGKRDIADKHSIGGIAGNRTTPIVVSICAAAGMTMPKTSSRAITSAAGTADVMETLTKVDLTSSDLQKVVKKTGACLAWGGSLGLAPADDKLIRVERLLNIDPEAQLIASILAKKISAGSKHILIDIPYGFGAKVTESQAKGLGKRFVDIGRRFGLNIKIMTTDGSQPIGNGIGPNLEMRDVLSVLRRHNPPLDLEKKAILLASTLLEMTGTAQKGNGLVMAKSILDSGAAYKKFDEIITAQGKKHNSLKTGRFEYHLTAKSPGTIKSIDNKKVNHAANLLGCPEEKSAGLYLYKHKNEKFSIGDRIVTFYAESQSKLEEAKDFWKGSRPIEITH